MKTSFATWMMLLTLGLCPGVFAVTGGQNVPVGDALEKHVVLIFNQVNFKFCTGTLLQRDIVLTAAHCLEEPYSDYLVSMGSDPYKQKSVRTSIVKVAKLKNQKEWTQEERSGDLALLKVAKPFAKISGSEVQLADDQWKDLKLSEFTAVGFGNESELPKLQRVDLKLGSTALGNSILSVPEQMPKSVGHGDSGGPAFLYFNNQLFIAGVASGKNLDSKASIYASVLSSKKWILKTLKDLSAE